MISKYLVKDTRTQKLSIIDINWSNFIPPERNQTSYQKKTWDTLNRQFTSQSDYEKNLNEAKFNFVKQEILSQGADFEPISYINEDGVINPAEWDIFGVIRCRIVRKQDYYLFYISLNKAIRTFISICNRYLSKKIIFEKEDNNAAFEFPEDVFENAVEQNNKLVEKLYNGDYEERYGFMSDELDLLSSFCDYYQIREERNNKRKPMDPIQEKVWEYIRNNSKEYL